MKPVSNPCSMLCMCMLSLLVLRAAGASCSADIDKQELSWSKLKVLDASTGVFVFDEFLSAAECEHLIQLAEPRMSRSGVVATSGNGTGEGVRHAVRTSSGAAFSRGEDEVVKAIEERIARWSLLPVSHQENMQVLRYNADEQYRQHWDFFSDNTTVQNGGNRHTTVIVYLSDVEAGGETVFPLLQPSTPTAEAGLSECASKGLAVKPKRGTALLWHNLTPEGKLEPRSLHAGCPVTSGSKFVLAKWIRAQPYVTMEERVAQAALRQAGIMQMANLLAVAAAR